MNTSTYSQSSLHRQQSLSSPNHAVSLQFWMLYSFSHNSNAGLLSSAKIRYKKAPGKWGKIKLSPSTSSNLCSTVPLVWIPQTRHSGLRLLKRVRTGTGDTMLSPKVTTVSSPATLRAHSYIRDFSSISRDSSLVLDQACDFRQCRHDVTASENFEVDDGLSFAMSEFRFDRINIILVQHMQRTNRLDSPVAVSASTSVTLGSSRWVMVNIH